MVTSSQPTSTRSRAAGYGTPRARGRPPSLTRDGVVQAALRLTREVGLENLSMRALARELGVPPMTIYHYAPNRGYLHALVVDDILSEIRVPRTDEGNWEDRLRKLLHDARRVFAQHPGVSAHLGDGGSAEGARLAGGRSDDPGRRRIQLGGRCRLLCNAVHVHDGSDRPRRNVAFRRPRHFDGDIGYRDPFRAVLTRGTLRARLRRRHGGAEEKAFAAVM